MAFSETARTMTRYLPFLGSHQELGIRSQPECVVLGVREGVTPSAKPPVRIFLGTQLAQYRAERVFFWSVEQVRDPGRVYEIYLMKELHGFDRRGWLTGFTNYRFAIPHLAGGFGKAIYNDVDQVYLDDPGELFDTDMGAHGYLSLSDRDTAVMLIDCQRMATVWSLGDAQRERRSTLEAKARSIPGLYGPLHPIWHARDAEYVANQSKLLHYTAIHMQPWQPMPHRYSYQRNPAGHVWFDLERAADAAHYQVFTAEHPSAQYRALQTREGQSVPTPPDSTNTNTEDRHNSHPETKALTLADLLAPEFVQQSHEQIECIRSEALAYIPAEDLPWVLDALFSRASHQVRASVPTTILSPTRASGTVASEVPRDPSWWKAQFEAAGIRHAKKRWHLTVHTYSAWQQPVRQVYEGGFCGNELPRVWVLTDTHPGNTTQSVGLAQALGWSYELKALRFTPLIHLHDALLGAFGATRLGLQRTQSAPLVPPWPDLVIATGWRTAHIARWIKRQSRDRTRLVQMGRKGTHVAPLYDLAISCRYFRLPPHPRRVETLAPITQVSAEQLTQAAERWRDQFAAAPSPRIALLVGGSSYAYRFDPETAQRLGEEVRAFATSAGGTVLATTSRRTGPQATEALKNALGESCYFHEWQTENPYLAFLASADILIVTGDSESMLAEATATGKPVYIYPLPKQPLNWWVQLKERIVARSERQRVGKRGTIQPQTGMQYLCARLVEWGIILPQPDLELLHQTLVDRKVAQFFSPILPSPRNSGLQEVETIVQRVRALLGMP